MVYRYSFCGNKLLSVAIYYLILFYRSLKRIRPCVAKVGDHICLGRFKHWGKLSRPAFVDCLSPREIDVSWTAMEIPMWNHIMLCWKWN